MNQDNNNNSKKMIIKHLLFWLFDTINASDSINWTVRSIISYSNFTAIICVHNYTREKEWK